MTSIRLLTLIAAVALVLAGCGAPAAPVPDETIATRPAASPETQSAATSQPEPTDTAQPLPTPTSEAAADPSPTPEPAPTAAPSPVETPASDESAAAGSMAARFPSAPTAAGEVIFVTGRVMDLSGAPLAGAAVEFWQTDAAGVYDHPGDSGTGSRDRGFQFYGTAIAGEDGSYAFRTVRPGNYEPRPKHIHVKVKIDGATVLTTQFYFEEDRASLGNEGLFSQAGSLGDLLVLRAADSVAVDGQQVAVLTNDLIIDTGAPGSLTATPPQGEGPYYPLAVVADFDSDLAVVP